MFQSIKQNSINLAKHSTNLISWDSKNSHLVKEALQNPENEQIVKSLFKQLDADGSGSLEEDEFKKLALSFLKINGKMADQEVDGLALTLGMKLFKLSDFDKTGKVKYSAFHWLIMNYDSIDQLLQEHQESESNFDSNHIVTARVTLLASPPGLPYSSAFSSQTSQSSSSLLGGNSSTSTKDSRTSIDSSLPLKKASPIISLQLFPTDNTKDFLFFLNNNLLPLNSNYSLSDFNYSEDRDEIKVFPCGQYRKGLFGTNGMKYSLW
jgi:hypothetical protein